MFDSTGTPVDGAQDLELAVYDVVTGGTAVWTETQTGVVFDNGYYAITLNDLVIADFASQDDMWVGLTLNAGVELPRIKLSSVPYALVAGEAQNVAAGGVVNTTSVVVNGGTVIDSSGNIDYSVLINGPETLGGLTCASGDLAEWDGANWACVAHVHDTSDITTGILDMARLPVGTGSNNVARGDHDHAADYLPLSAIDTTDAGVLTGAGDADSLHTHATLATQADVQTLASGTAGADNLVTNGSFELWSRASQPDGWFVSGATLAGDTTIVNAGVASINMTAAAPGDFAFATIDNFAEYAGKTVTFAIDIDDGGLGATIEIDDGVGQSSTAYSGSGWQRVLVTHTLDAAPTKLGVRVIAGGAGTLYLDAATLAYGGHTALPYVPESNYTNRQRSMAYYEHHDHWNYGNDHSENNNWVQEHRAYKANGTLTSVISNFGMTIWTGAYTGGLTQYSSMSAGSYECAVSGERRDEVEFHCEVGGAWQTNSTYGVRLRWDTMVDKTW